LYPGINDVVRGCRIQEHRLETIANNLANANTTGFKKDILSFDHLLSIHQKANLAQGNIRHTGNAVDLALSGEGFFKVSTQDGIRYTRNGKFHVNAEGQLVTPSGHPVLGEGGPISIEGTDVVVDDIGKVSVDGEEVDTLAVVSFGEPELLQKQGDSYYVYNGDEGEGPTPQETSVKQGYLEESNVVVTQEMIKMIETLRHFESYQKVLQTFDETDAKVINEVGKL
jgi:flagellar basal-body rod protein FlgF